MTDVIELKSTQKITKNMLNSHLFEKYEKLTTELKELQTKPDTENGSRKNIIIA
jgi:hypothetical protein